jgi:Tol biopolymer transport system component
VSSAPLGIPAELPRRPKWRRRTVLFVSIAGVLLTAALLALALSGPPTPVSDSLPKYSPDGRYIAFSSNRDGYLDIFLMTADGSQVIQLTKDRFAWLYFSRSPTDAWPTWSPDGRRIAFSSGRDNHYMSWINMSLYVMDSDGSNVMRLIDSGRADNQPAWSPDGQRIAFASSRPDLPNHIYVIDADGTNLRQLTDGNSVNDQPAWSPDGSRIAFVSNRDGTPNIYVMQSDGTDLVRVTEGGGDIANVMPAWSPDGERIAFASNRDGEFEIYVMSPDGSNIVKLTTSGGNSMPAWSPDSQKIAFASDRDGHIYVMAADGSHVVRLANR